MGRATDAVGLDDLASGKSGAAPGSALRVGGKSLVLLFLIFLLISSSLFIENVLSGCKGAVHCREPTSFGHVLQGIFLVIFYAVSTHLVDAGVV